MRFSLPPRAGFPLPTCGDVLMERRAVWRNLHPRIDTQQGVASALRLVRVKRLSDKNKLGISMVPTKKGAHQTARGFFLITALLLLPHLAVTSAMAQGSACPCSIFSTTVNPGAE